MTTTGATDAETSREASSGVINTFTPDSLPKATGVTWRSDNSDDARFLDCLSVTSGAIPVAGR